MDNEADERFAISARTTSEEKTTSDSTDGGQQRCTKSAESKGAPKGQDYQI
jgi:hypothetical protein